MIYSEGGCRDQGSGAYLGELYYLFTHFSPGPSAELSMIYDVVVFTVIFRELSFAFNPFILFTFYFVFICFAVSTVLLVISTLDFGSVGLCRKSTLL
jgi:hypothetical protein